MYCFSEIKFWLYFLWQLPQNIVALLMLPFLGKLKPVVYHSHCIAFECTKMNGGISLGNFIFLSPELAKREVSIMHEYGHVKQSHYLGWLYLIVIGIPSILNAMFNFTDCYYSWYTESWANKIAGLKVSKNQYKCFIYKNKKEN